MSHSEVDSWNLVILQKLCIQGKVIFICLIVWYLPDLQTGFILVLPVQLESRWFGLAK